MVRRDCAPEDPPWASSHPLGGRCHKPCASEFKRLLDRRRPPPDEVTISAAIQDHTQRYGPPYTVEADGVRWTVGTDGDHESGWGDHFIHEGSEAQHSPSEVELGSGTSPRPNGPGCCETDGRGEYGAYLELPRVHDSGHVLGKRRWGQCAPDVTK